jgi:hypothetical protein
VPSNTMLVRVANASSANAAEAAFGNATLTDSGAHWAEAYVYGI